MCHEEKPTVSQYVQCYQVKGVWLLLRTHPPEGQCLLGIVLVALSPSKWPSSIGSWMSRDVDTTKKTMERDANELTWLLEDLGQYYQWLHF